MQRRVVPLGLPRASSQRSPVTPKWPNHALCLALGGSGCLSVPLQGAGEAAGAFRAELPPCP